uniref:LAGLIDADG endonuclease n=1 Tax=Peronospora matthiolae TaxID=2874970 RepID=A0AAV1TCX2_9STRA
MEFLKFSVKPSTSFHGTILFKFKSTSDAEPKTTYAVEINNDQRVVTRKNVDARDVHSTCDVTISMDDFLWIYSGKASSSDLLKLFYAGRVAISGYAFRSVSKFAQSFDFSSEKWCSFYAWQKAHDQENDDSRALGLIEEGRSIGAPSRNDWFLRARTMLDSCNLSRLQQLLWETSLTHLFGEKIVLDSMRRASVRDRKSAAGRCSAAASVMGDAGPVSAVLKRHTTGAMIPGQLHYGREQRAVLTRFLHPCMKQSAVVAKALALGNPKQTAGVIFDFVNEDYVGDVKRYAKQRQQRRHYRNRVDLGDAGMAQLDKLVQVIGKGGHSNQKWDNRSKYVPAPERLLREFRVNVASLMDTVKEKASGRKALRKIPAPEMDFLVRNGRSGSMVVADSSSSLGKRTTAEQPLSAISALPNLPQSFIVEVNRAKIARNRKRFDVPKRRLKATFASISRELANQKNPVATHFDEHLVFSDYL